MIPIGDQIGHLEIMMSDMEEGQYIQAEIRFHALWAGCGIQTNLFQCVKDFID